MSSPRPAGLPGLHDSVLVMVLLFGLLVPPARAANRPSIGGRPPHDSAPGPRHRVEVGTKLGLTIDSSDDPGVVMLGIPGAGSFGQPALYALVLGRHAMTETQLAFSRLSSDGTSQTLLNFGLHRGHLFRSGEEDSAYLLLGGAFQYVGGYGSNLDLGLGSGFGYRLLAGPAFSVRFEALYHRWFDNHINELTFGVGLGALVR